eukprot:1432165-Pleurochrysis_carterae.AAC.1
MRPRQRRRPRRQSGENRGVEAAAHLVEPALLIGAVLEPLERDDPLAVEHRLAKLDGAPAEPRRRRRLAPRVGAALAAHAAPRGVSMNCHAREVQTRAHSPCQPAPTRQLRREAWHAYP